MILDLDDWAEKYNKTFLMITFFLLNGNNKNFADGIIWERSCQRYPSAKFLLLPFSRKKVIIRNVCCIFSANHPNLKS